MRSQTTAIPVIIGALVMGSIGLAAYAIAEETDQVEASPEQSQTRAQQLMGGIAPKMVELTDDVLYGDIWERPELSKRDRSLVTVSALVAMNRPDQLRSHLRLARRNGLTEEELIEAITHLAFYSGWPNAVTAISIAKEVFAAEED